MLFGLNKVDYFHIFHYTILIFLCFKHHFPTKNKEEDIFEALRQVGRLVNSLNSGSGTQFNPARTCHDLKRDHPEKKDG